MPKQLLRRRHAPAAMPALPSLDRHRFPSLVNLKKWYPFQWVPVMADQTRHAPSLTSCRR